MLVPVLSADTLPRGVLLLANKRGGRPFTEHDANLSRAFALLAGTVADNIRLYAAAEEQSRQADEARRYYWALMEKASEAVLVMDATTKTIIDVNQRAIDLFGYSREEFLAFPPGWDTRSGREQATGDGVTRATVRDGSFHTTRPREHLRKDGTPLLLRVSASRVDTPRGPVVLTLCREADETDATETSQI